MKKLTRMLYLLMVAALLCVMLASCAGKPNEDPKVARRALRNSGYMVNLITEDDILERQGYEGLVAIVAAEKTTPEIDVELLELDELSEDELDELDGKNIIYDGLQVYYFEDEDAAKEAFKTLEDELIDRMDELAEEIDEQRRSFKKAGYDFEFAFEYEMPFLDGCMIYVGTSDALRDAAKE